MDQSAQPQVISCLNVAFEGKIDSKGVAYRDEGESYEDFLRKVSENETILGFEWDKANQKLGIIIA